MLNPRFMLPLACFTFFAASTLPAQVAPVPAAQVAPVPAAQVVPVPAAQDRLRLVVILSRHGVRPPTWTPDRLNAYSAKPWPAWTAAPGELTEHGYKLLETLGAYDRATLLEEGLFDAGACSGSDATYLWADTDQRTLASGHALADGLFPPCAPHVHSFADGRNDPLFHPPLNALPASVTAAALLELKQRIAAQSTSADDPLLRSVQNVLNGCAAAAPCTPERMPQSTLSSAPTAAVPGKGDRLADLQGPLPLASTFSEDFLLEYAEGMPTADVGWSHVDESQLRRLIALHTRYFDLMHRTPAIARLESGAMLRQIGDTLQQAVEGSPIAGTLVPPENRLVLFVGHDTNLAGVAALLGLHWSLDGRPDDTSPGTELVFELRQSASGQYSVRTLVRQQTLQQMRSLQPLDRHNPPAQAVLQPSGCAPGDCNWTAFHSQLLSALAER